LGFSGKLSMLGHPDHQTGPSMATETDLKLGHNGGPELEDDDPTGRLLFVKWAWTRAHDDAWKTPPMDILRFRVARAEAAGLTYREYMLQLLDTGTYPQAKPAGSESKPKRPLAKPGAANHALRAVPPAVTTPPATPLATTKSGQPPAPAPATSVDSRVAHARKPSPMNVGGLHKVHK
jgi:hypothetical protein